MNEPPESFLAFLETSRRAYVASLPGMLAALEPLWIDAGDATGAEGLAELERASHSIAGTAGTFGLTQVGSAGRNLELAVHRLAATDAAGTVAGRAEVGLALAELRLAIGKPS
jgi:periplasmic divalent cation tolerance protein